MKHIAIPFKYCKDAYYQKMLRLSSLYCTHEDWSTADSRTCSYCTVGSMYSLAKIKNRYAYRTCG